MATARKTVQAEKRTVVGRKVSRLRLSGKIPANMYGNGKDSTPLTLDAKEFTKLYASAGETTLLDLMLTGEKTGYPVLIRDVSFHPVTDAIVHVDFEQVSLKEKVHATIPVEVIGESQAVKDGAVLVVVHNEIEIEALPTDLPEKFIINIEKLAKIGDDILLEDIAVDRSIISIEMEPTEVIATVQAQEEEKVEEVVTEPVEVELTKQGATKEVAEGETETSTPKTE